LANGSLGADIKTIDAPLYINYDDGEVVPGPGNDVRIGRGGAGNEANLCLNDDCIASWPGGGSGYWNQLGNDLYPSTLTWNVGIGTATPSNRLEVDSLAANESGLRFTQLTSGSPVVPNPSGKVLALGATGDVVLVTDTGGAGSDELVKISGADTTAGFLDGKIMSGDGSISFNTVNPGANEQLDIRALGGGGSGFWEGVSGNHINPIDSVNTKVGIGTPSPDMMLEVKGPNLSNGNALADDDGTWIKARGSTGAGYEAGAFWVQYGPNRAPLLVLQDSDDPPRIQFQEVNTGTPSAPEFASWIGLADDFTDDVSIMGGEVGLGVTNQASKLHVQSDETWGTDVSIDADHVAGGDRWQLFSTGGTATEGQGKFIIKDADTGINGLTIDSDGNVGIGENNPSKELHVAGNARITGLICTGNAYGGKVTTDGFGNLFCDDDIAGGSGLWEAGATANTINPINETIDKVAIGRNDIADNTQVSIKNNSTDKALYVEQVGTGHAGYFSGRSVFMDGNVGIGDDTPLALLTVGAGDRFRVDSSGNIRRINNIVYSWPSGQGGANTVLTNNGNGTLSWAVAGSDGKVKITNNDTTANFLQSKLVEGSNITLTLVGSGGNETLRIDATGGGGIDGSGAVNHAAFWLDADTLSSDSNFYWNNASNRLGIGTSSPTQRLDVSGGDINTSGVYRKSGTAGVTVDCGANQFLQDPTVSGGILTAGSCVDAGGGGTITGSGTANRLAKFSGATAINDSNIFQGTGGMIGIDGTPVGGYGQFQLVGSASESAGMSYNVSQNAFNITVYAGGTTTFKIDREDGFSFDTGSTTGALNILDNGHVGIGHDSPGAKLAVAHPDAPYSDHNTISAYNNSTNSNAYDAVAGYKKGADVDGSAIYGEIDDNLTCQAGGLCAAVYGSDGNGGDREWAGFFNGEFEVKDGSVLFDGSTGDTPISGAGRRFMWIPDKYALRAGRVTGDDWDVANIGVGSVAFGTDNMAKGQGSVALGYLSETLGDYDFAAGRQSKTGSNAHSSVAMGYRAETGASQPSWAMGYRAVATGNYSMALGQNAYATTASSLSIGLTDANFETYSDHIHSLAIGLDDSDCHTTTGGQVKICGDLEITGSISKASGTFTIPHPDPEKPEGTKLTHSFVESPTAGDNLYRWTMTVENGEATIELPDYYTFLNENDMVWVSPKGHFGRAFGEVDQSQKSLNIKADTDGEYNVLLIGTRKDKDAFENWKGVESFVEPE
ncbi:hypothetical protein KJ782_06845, partial [Patescibacteria group bacterium]|nr:hypothetical protein [Patescibacteria group bacterium]